MTTISKTPKADRIRALREEQFQRSHAKGERLRAPQVKRSSRRRRKS
jgi:hypothetical protein